MEVYLAHALLPKMDAKIVEALKSDPNLDGHVLKSMLDDVNAKDDADQILASTQPRTLTARINQLKTGCPPGLTMAQHSAQLKNSQRPGASRCGARARLTSKTARTAARATGDNVSLGRARAQESKRERALLV